MTAPEAGGGSLHTVAIALHHRVYRVGNRYYGDIPNLLDLILALGRQAGHVVLCLPAIHVAEPPSWTDELPAEIEIVELPYYGSNFELMRRLFWLVPGLLRKIVPAVRTWDIVGGVAPSGFGLLTVMIALVRRRRGFFLIRGNVLATLHGEHHGSRWRRSLVIGAMLPLHAITRALVRAGVVTFTFGPALASMYPGPHVHVLRGYARSEIAGSEPPSPVADEAELRRLLFVGRLTGEKGVDILLKAIAILKERDINVTLGVAGEGSDGDSLRDLARTLEIADRVEFLGYIQEPKQLRSLYLDSGVLVLPSRTEGLPTVVLEAMALSRIVVGTRVGGIPSLVNHGQTGLLVERDDVDGLAEALAWIAQNPSESFKLSQEAGIIGRSRGVDDEARRILAAMQSV